jgi:hypothetical protein
MRFNEIPKDVNRPAVQNDLFHLLLEIERQFRAEERNNLSSKRGSLHQNFVKIIKDTSEKH